jgi:hypothetical protein
VLRQHAGDAEIAALLAERAIAVSDPRDPGLRD